MIFMTNPATKFSSNVKRIDGIRPRVLELLPQYSAKLQGDSVHLKSNEPSSDSTSGSVMISPPVILIIVIVAVVVFLAGVLHLLVRFLMNKRCTGSLPTEQHSDWRHSMESAHSDALQRQLQQLFHLHDSGLDQALIDVLPVFLYKEIIGSKEPFDCAVCLCEFAEKDKLRLLPACGHAFHIDCIDTWLLSNSTCPLCRGLLFMPDFPFEDGNFYFRNTLGEIFAGNDHISLDMRNSPEEGELKDAKTFFPVRLGKFKNLSKIDNIDVKDSNDISVSMDEGETSGVSLDTRRCFSMGSYQYVVGDASLHVYLCCSRDETGKIGNARNRGTRGGSIQKEAFEGNKIFAGKGDSFSVSKIWQWSNKGKMPVISAFDSSPTRSL